MKKIIITFILCLPTLAWAESSAKKSLEKAQANYENSVTNLADYKKNLQVVEGNLAEIAKVKGQVEGQEKELGTTASSNKKSLQTLTGKESEITKLMTSEQNQIQAEEKKVQELEKMIAQIRENQKKRLANIQSYQGQATQAVQEKKEWTSRQEQINGAHSQAKSKLNSVLAQEKEWKNKKKTYEAEISKWDKEVAKQKKILDNLKTLADVKD